MTQIEELQIELQENRELLATCIAYGDTKGVSVQRKVIALIERKINEYNLFHSSFLEILGERYGYDYY